MVKSKDNIERITYSVRLNPELLKKLKHLCIEENKPIGELIEGIKLLFTKRRLK